MRTRPVRLVAAAVFAFAGMAGITRAQEVLTNETLVQLVTGKVAKPLILSKMQSSPNTFDVTVPGLMYLTQAKVPDDLIKAAILRVPQERILQLKEVLTNESVVQMSTGKVNRELMLMKIRGTKSAFDLTANGLVSLQQNKVHPEVVKAMMAVPVTSEADIESELKATGSFSLYGVLFDTGASVIKDESIAVLAPVGEMLKSQPALKLEIQGHTDNVGTPGANLKLSQERASAVKSHLVQTFGIAAARLTAVGLGDTKPVADNATDDGRAKNRRVDLVKK